MADDVTVGTSQKWLQHSDRRVTPPIYPLPTRRFPRPPRGRGYGWRFKVPVPKARTQRQSRAVRRGVRRAAVLDSDVPFRRLRVTRRCALCSVHCALCSLLCALDASATFRRHRQPRAVRRAGPGARRAPFLGVTGAYGTRNRLHVGRHRRHAVRHSHAVTFQATPTAVDAMAHRTALRPYLVAAGRPCLYVTPVCPSRQGPWRPCCNPVQYN